MTNPLTPGELTALAGEWLDLGERIAAATERRNHLATLIQSRLAPGDAFAGVRVAPPSKTLDEDRAKELCRLGIITEADLQGCYEMKFTAPAAKRALTGATLELAKVAKGQPTVKSA